MRAIKLFADGAMGSRGALLFEPYADDPTHHRGLMLIDPKVLEATTTAEALRQRLAGLHPRHRRPGQRPGPRRLRGGPPCAVPEARDPRLRNRARPARSARRTCARFAASGTIASMQPSHCSDEIRWADARLGPDRSQGAYAWRWFADGGSDARLRERLPGRRSSIPFYGLYAAVTRQQPDGRPARAAGTPTSV